MEPWWRQYCTLPWSGNNNLIIACFIHPWHWPSNKADYNSNSAPKTWTNYISLVKNHIGQIMILLIMLIINSGNRKANKKRYWEKLINLPNRPFYRIQDRSLPCLAQVARIVKVVRCISLKMLHQFFQIWYIDFSKILHGFELKVLNRWSYSLLNALGLLCRWQCLQFSCLFCWRCFCFKVTTTICGWQHVWLLSKSFHWIVDVYGTSQQNSVDL